MLPSVRRCVQHARVPTRRAISRGLAKGKTKGAVSLINPSGEINPRSLALATALKQVEMNHGRGSVMNLGSHQQVAKVDVISTGSLGLDHALGVGGLPKGRVVEVYGAESSGKTTVALQVVAECQRQGGTAVFVDAEHALDAAYAKALGVDLERLYVSQPDSGEQALDIVETLVRSGAVDLVVVDSVAALVPRAELEGDMGDHHVALQARLMSQAMRKLTAALARTNCLIVFINQTRQKVGVIFGSNEVTSGGTALRFYSSVRLEVRKGQVIKRDGDAIGVVVKVKVAKNKLAPPFGTAEFDLLFGAGRDHVGELVDLGTRVGVLRKSGAWYTVAPDASLAQAISHTGSESSKEESEALQVDGGGSDSASSNRRTPPGSGDSSGPWLLGQGREKCKAFLAARPALVEALETAVRERLANEGSRAPVPLAVPGDGVVGYDAISDAEAVEESAGWRDGMNLAAVSASDRL